MRSVVAFILVERCPSICFVRVYHLIDCTVLGHNEWKSPLRSEVCSSREKETNRSCASTKTLRYGSNTAEIGKGGPRELKVDMAANFSNWAREDVSISMFKINK